MLLATDEAAGYRGIIAIHSTRLGPAVGGTRVWRYASQEAALEDALRLSRGMTYKCALAGLPFGGGKAVIWSDEIRDREQIFRAHGRFVDSLKGSYITAEGVGTSTADMEIVRQETRYVGGLMGGSGDPSPHTARGVFRAMQAAARHRWGSDSLRDKRVAIQGCGNVGTHLARELRREAAALLVSDIDAQRAETLSGEINARVVAPAEIHAVKADVFAPCALGGVLNDDTVPLLNAAIVCGAANNQLLEPRHGEMLRERGILYVPDYAANAGGVINGACREMLGWSTENTLKKIEGIYGTIVEILKISDREKMTTNVAADRLAEQRLA